MVIANSDSNSTLVSLNNIDKHGAIDENAVVADGETGLLRYKEHSTAVSKPFPPENNKYCPYGGVATELLISSPNEERIPLYLPPQEDLSLSIDEYVSRNYYNIQNNENESDWDSYHSNLSKCPLNLTEGAKILKKSRKRLLTTRRRRNLGDHQVLYVAQGERANATSEQYDVLMSDKATTCHILAFRSKSNGLSQNGCAGVLPLTSLTHLDGPQYEECVRKMVQEHLDYHQHQDNRHSCKRKRANYVGEEKKSDDFYESHMDSRNDVSIDVHVVGGFNDSDFSSSSITDWLMRLLAQLAKEFKDDGLGIEISVKTLVVSSSNNELDDRNNDSPIGRGFGIDLKTGDVFLTENQKDSSICGPVPTLRSVRLWSRCSSKSKKLSVVHSVKDADDLWTSYGIDENDTYRKEYSLFWVQPFRFRSIPDVNLLLGLSDELLLQYTSTSPDVEEENFCQDVRASLQFLKDRCETEKDDGRSYFGKGFDQPMVFAMRRKLRPSGNDPKQQTCHWNQLPF